MLPAFRWTAARAAACWRFPSAAASYAHRGDLGGVFAFLFVFAGLLWSNFMLVALAFFVFMAGQQELALVRMQARRRLNAGPYLPATGDILDVEPVPVETAFNGAVWDQNHRVWVLWQDGRPVRTYWMPGSHG